MAHFIKSPIDFFNNNLGSFIWGMTCKGTEDHVVRVTNPVMRVAITVGASVKVVIGHEEKQ